MTGMTAATSSVTRLGLQFYYCPSQQSSCTGNNGNLASQAISYPAAGTETAFSQNQKYAYDGVNRLTGFTESSVVQAYAYDGFGNR